MRNLLHEVTPSWKDYFVNGQQADEHWTRATYSTLGVAAPATGSRGWWWYNSRPLPLLPLAFSSGNVFIVIVFSSPTNCSRKKTDAREVQRSSNKTNVNLHGNCWPLNTPKTLIHISYISFLFIIFIEFIYLFVLSLFHFFLNSFFRLIFHSLADLLFLPSVHFLFHSFAYSVFCSFVYSSIRSFVCAFVLSFV